MMVMGFSPTAARGPRARSLADFWWQIKHVRAALGSSPKSERPQMPAITNVMGMIDETWNHFAACRV